MKTGFEFAVGEKFIYEGVEYECAPSTDHCDGCDFFHGWQYLVFFCPIGIICSKKERSDGKSVIFKRTGKCIEHKKKTEFAVNEEFQCGFKTLRCVAIDANSPKKTCDGCVFYVDMACADYLDFAGHCRKPYRSDATDVIFVEVKPENKEK